MTDYQTYLADKRTAAPDAGIVVEHGSLHPSLFPFQRDLVRWSLRKGRAAIFADTGLGKTFMQLEWARHAANRTLLLAPLAVARQTVREGITWGVDVCYARREQDAPQTGIVATNYEMLSHFDVGAYGAVVLDESSILKSYDGKTRQLLIETFARTPYRLCCTATPAPNDIAEIANHAEFLGIMTRVEMLSHFFVHDDNGWRLKKHGRDAFWKWMASWGMSMRWPSDLGYSDEGYRLPELVIEPHILPTDYAPDGCLFTDKLRGITERSSVRRETIDARVARCAEIVLNEPHEQWLAWCGLNEEGRRLAALVGGTIVEGADDPDTKANALTSFASGGVRILVSKPSIAGFGMNFQSCARMVFVGIGDSYEQYYQAIRRCYRFGQTRPVQVHVVLTEPERCIYENVLRKEDEARNMGTELVQNVAEYEREEIGSQSSTIGDYAEDADHGHGWRMMLGDSAERLREIPDASIGLSVFSPPFQSLYTYSPSERDLGNSRSVSEFWEHFSFISRELLRVMQPGRNVCVHVSQLPTTLTTHGVIGLSDFRGTTIEHFVKAGFVYHGECCIDKDPQAQAIRTHSKGLLFVQLRKDASWLRPGLADYILVFRAPGDNAVPIHPDISNDEWIEWARPIWYGIRESHTLNAAVARDNNDERHICPLQLGTIERCMRLWSNPGETVLSPFAGIGSEGYVAVQHGRKFVGVELKPSYWKCACRNLRDAEHAQHGLDLFADDAPDLEAIA